MKKYLLTLFCLFVLRLQAAPIEATDPVGQRFGMCLLEVLDSVFKEGLYHYAGSSGKPRTSEEPITVQFEDNKNERLLIYGFSKDKCDLAMMVLPLTALDATVRGYDQQFLSLGKQLWRTPNGTIKVSVAIGKESMRNDHKPHLLVVFDPSL